MPGRPLLIIVGLAGVAGLLGCSEEDGVGGIVGAPVAAAGGGTTTTSTGDSTTMGGPTTAGASTTGVTPSTVTSGTSGPATTATATRLRLGGDDLGVTRLGAPFRDAVAAVSAELGRPSGDPAPDTACIGAEEEASWGAFRLASSGSRLSGWLSKSTTLATPAGATVGTTLAALRQAYGERLQVRPPPEPDGFPVFVVGGINLGGTLTGPAPTDTVSSMTSGTCEAV